VPLLPPQMFIPRNISNHEEYIHWTRTRVHGNYCRTALSGSSLQEIYPITRCRFSPLKCSLLSNHEEYIHWTRTRVHGNYCRTALSGKCSLKVVHSDLIGISAQSDKKF
jgi:hypothetical protein